MKKLRIPLFIIIINVVGLTILINDIIANPRYYIKPRIALLFLIGLTFFWRLIDFGKQVKDIESGNRKSKA
jgi:hypothetical protein